MNARRRSRGRRSRFSALLLAASITGPSLALLTPVELGAAPAATALPQGEARTNCTLTVTHSIFPSVVLAGETVDVSLRVEPHCPVVDQNLHVVFLIPSSSEVSARDRMQVRKDARELADEVLDNDGWECCGTMHHARVGFVSYDSQVRSSCDPTNEPARVERCFSFTPTARPAQNLAAALEAGERLLARARPVVGELREILVLVAGGEDDTATRHGIAVLEPRPP